ncbi:hypothetical protein GCM10029992_11130 [Glycomyces albus]
MTFDFNALRDMRDPHDMIRHLEGMRAQAQEQLAQMQERRDALAAMSVTRTDPDGMVTITVGSDGNLRELFIAPHVTRQQYRRLGPVIIATLADARDELREQLSEAGPR